MWERVNSVNLAHLIWTGENKAIERFPKGLESDAEVAKRIAAHLRRSSESVAFDNVSQLPFVADTLERHLDRTSNR